MDKLEEKIGYRFKNRGLLVTALTHSSYANERHSTPCQSYERLEFLGDSILGYVTAEFLYSHEPSLPEGRMTRLRAELVCEGSLRERPSILADMVESIIAALYLDSGIDEARRFIMANVLAGAELGEAHHIADYKTELQELIQRRSNQVISYELIGESGPDHNKLFTFRVLINGVPTGEGSGRSKKEAEQMAACKALEALKK